MRAYLPAYHLEKPRDLNEVLQRLSPGAGPLEAFCGRNGPLMVLLEAGKIPHRNFSERLEAAGIARN